ncbi:MAG: hypothetical protein KC496_19745, partial [Anaerolineae bacterium]|nr:hypothetical protein [Anaerolineae bacterium]
IRAAEEAGCDLVFMVGMTEEIREQHRGRGFIDSGSIVVYAEKPDKSNKEDAESAEESQNIQSVLVV